MMYYWAESAFAVAYGFVPPYYGTTSLQGRILGLDLNFYPGPLVTAAFAIPFYLGFLSFGLVMGRGIIRAIQDRTLRVLATLLPGGGVHDIYLTPPYQHVWFSSGDKEFNPMTTDPDKLNDDELLISFQKLYDTVEPGGSLSIILPAWATGVGDRFQRLMPDTGFTIESAEIIYRAQGKPETELRFRKPTREVNKEPQTASSAPQEEVSTPAVEGPSPLGQGAIESTGPPVVDIPEELPRIPARLAPLERSIVKAAVEALTQHQQPVPYRELLNEVYMDLVDRRVDFDSARQIETTLLNHNGREILLIEEADEANARIIKKWSLGEERLSPEKKRRISIFGRISGSKTRIRSLRFRRKHHESGYVEKKASDEN
jgi:hypothetical protein